jgi:hypothetical protein
LIFHITHQGRAFERRGGCSGAPGCDAGTGDGLLITPAVTSSSTGNTSSCVDEGPKVSQSPVPIDLTEDEAWEPTLNPYRGRITPAWEIVAEARWRLGYPLEHAASFSVDGEGARE